MEDSCYTTAVRVLAFDTLDVPDESESKIMAKAFNDKWNFPNCVGTFDRKHIPLQAPIGSGTKYFNYKGFFSIVLFAVVDTNYNFTYANVGCQGWISDGGVLSENQFKQCMDNNTIGLPSQCPLPGRSNATSFVFLADDVFLLTDNIMKPYPGAQAKGSLKIIFNYRLRRARRISENTFRILSSLSRVFRKPMLLEPEAARIVVLSVIYLHNFLRINRSVALYNPNGVFHTESSITDETRPGLWRQAAPTQGILNIPKMARRSTIVAQEFRDAFGEYFITPEGMLPYQTDRYEP